MTYDPGHGASPNQPGAVPGQPSVPSQPSVPGQPPALGSPVPEPPDSPWAPPGAEAPPQVSSPPAGPDEQGGSDSPHPTAVLPQYPAAPYPYPYPYPTVPAAAYQPVAHDPGPRPVVVSTAAHLTFGGFALALAGTVLTYLFFDGLFAELVRISDNEAQAGEEFRQALDFYSGAGLTLAAALNVAAGTGAAVSAVFVLRGANAARVVLCCLAGGFAGWKLTCGGGWLINMINSLQELEQEGVTPAVFDPPYELMYAALAVDLVLALMAGAILVLLLLGPANRYFSRPKPPPPMMMPMPPPYPPAY